VGQLLEENAGLVDEILRNYEQLNLVFDVAQEISHATDISELERILLTRLGALLAADSLYVIRADGGSRRLQLDGGTVTEEHLPGQVMEVLAEPVRRVQQIKKVTVIFTDHNQFIIGPLVRLDDRVDIVIGLRSRTAAEFTSGDMLLFESVLAYGGQIISNSELHEKLKRMAIEAIRALVSAIDQKDHYTSGHSERVGFLARLTGKQMGLSPVQLEMLEWAGLMHDVGKIGIPENILNKPGSLTPEEYAQIKRHPVMGYEILKPVTSFEPILDAILYHHENPDGSGYPEGLKGDEIPLPARIVHVVDIFDGLSSDRSYRPAYPIEKACEILRENIGTKVDAEVTEAFLAALENFRTSKPDEFAELFRTAREDIYVYA